MRFCFLFQFILTLSILSNTITAQNTGTITGIVADETTKESLLGVNISCGSVNTTTDFVDGKYKLELEAGEQVLSFSYLGYTTLEKTVTIEAGKSVMNITLKEEATILETATITSSKFEKSLGETTVSIEVVQPSLIENTNAQAVNQVLEKVPGVNTMGDQVTIRGGAGFSQGTGSRVLILMDDMPVLQADAGLPNWADLPTENIAQMEVLKGAASALGSAALNGVINIRTAYPLNKPVTKIGVFGTLYGDPANASDKWWSGSNMPFETGVQIAHRRKIGKFDIVLDQIYFTTDLLSAVSERLMMVQLIQFQVTITEQELPSIQDIATAKKLFFTLNTNVNIGSQNVFLFHNRTDTNNTRL